MLKNILTHNIFFQDIWTEALSIPHNQLEVPLGCTREKVVYIISSVPFLAFVIVFELPVTGRAPKRRKADGLGNRL